MEHTIISLVVIALIGVQIWAVVAGREAWPFGANAMFSHSVNLETTLYDIALIAVLGDGTERRVEPPRDLGVLGAMVMRLFFVHYYGPPARGSPHGALEHDDAAAFAGRMASFSRIILGWLARRGTPAVRLRIEVHTIVRGEVVDVDTISSVGV
jgi:hypothetical protein